MAHPWLDMMARYSAWQNHELVAAANKLTKAEREADRGAFFGSISRTFSHVLWADDIWFSRIADHPEPASPFPGDMVWAQDWDRFRTARRQMDQFVLNWAAAQTEGALDGDVIWYAKLFGKEMSRSKQLVLTHVFNHAKHHRGQIHKMLTEQGVTTSDTDLIFMPEEGPWL